MLENITRREKLKGTDPPATDASRHTLTISPEMVCSLVVQCICVVDLDNRVESKVGYKLHAKNEICLLVISED